MNNKAVDAVNRSIHHQFPELNGVKPKIRTQIDTKGAPGPTGAAYLLIYQHQVSVHDGKKLSVCVRVVTDSDGKIFKISYSR
jgi:hypothetical protein